MAREALAGTPAGELLPFGLQRPHALVPLMWQNQRRLFSLLFEASASTLFEVAADPRHLGAGIGFLAIMHTWGQTLQLHPHIHCVVCGNGFVTLLHC